MFDPVTRPNAALEPLLAVGTHVEGYTMAPQLLRRSILWITELEAGTTGAPMTYMADGKQYIVVGIGETNRPAEFIALSLP